MADPSTMIPGQMVEFQSILASDTNIYYGKIVGLILPSIAIQHGDIIGYNKKINIQEALDRSYTELNFFLLERYVHTSDEPIDTKVFAQEWIYEPTYRIVGDFKKAILVINGLNDGDFNLIKDDITARGYIPIVKSYG